MKKTVKNSAEGFVFGVLLIILLHLTYYLGTTICQKVEYSFTCPWYAKIGLPFPLELDLLWYPLIILFFTLIGYILGYFGGKKNV
jgi:hypothetical protein